LRVWGALLNFRSGVLGGFPAANALLIILTPENTSGDNRFSNPTGRHPPVIWVTSQPGDSHLGDNFWATGRHQLGHPGVR